MYDLAPSKGRSTIWGTKRHTPFFRDGIRSGTAGLGYPESLAAT